MPRVLPSEVIPAIDSLFGAKRNEIDGGAITNRYRAEVRTLLTLLEEIPTELIDLPASDYLEYLRCRSVLDVTVARWNAGDGSPARDVGGKDPIERIRRLLKQCRDELPPPAPELPFITDTDIRLGIEDRIRAAWTDFNAREWLGATVLAGAALEAMLLWGLKHMSLVQPSKRPLDELHLTDLIGLAVRNRLIDPMTEQQASLAKDARNLVHPGRASRSGDSCNKASALTALAAAYRVADELAKRYP